MALKIYCDFVRVFLHIFWEICTREFLVYLKILRCYTDDVKIWLKITLLSLIILSGVLLAYQPHFDYPLPLVGDEYVHISFAKQLLDEGELPFQNPYFATQIPHTNFESGFHFFLAGTFSLIPADPVLFYKYFVIIFMVINSLLLFYLVISWFKDYYTALFAVFFFSTIKSANGLLAHQYFLPLTLGITLLLLSFIFFHKWIEGPKKRYLVLLCATLLVTAITYPPALFFFIGTMFFYILSTDHSLHTFVNMGKKKFLLYFLGFSIISAVLFITTLNYLGVLDKIIFHSSWDVIQKRLSPIFFFGIIPSFLALIGLIIVTMPKTKKPKIIVYWFLFSVSVMYFFYLFDFSVLIPFPRLFVFYLIGISILAGIGGAGLMRFVKNLGEKKYLISAIVIIIVLGISQYSIVSKKPLEHSNILTQNLYNALKFLKEQYPARVIVIADSITSLAVYPVSGKYVVNLLDSNVGGGDPLITRKFIDSNCEEKKTALYELQRFIRHDEKVSPTIVFLSKKRQGCAFMSPILDTEPYMYILDPHIVAEALKENSEFAQALIPKPPSTVTQPVGVSTLSGSDIHEKIIGNTVEGETGIEFYQPDGQIMGQNKNTGESYTGFWDITGESMCVYFPTNTHGARCLTVAVSNENVWWFDMDGNKRPADSKLLKGNYYNF